MPKFFLLEYVRYLLHVDEIYFIKSKNNIHVVYHITLRGYAFENYKGVGEEVKILKEISFLLDKPWKYGPHLIISKIKGNVKVGPNDHENWPEEERLTNQHSWM